MIFGLSIIPVLALAGAGIDLQAVRSERQRMQDALDAATLAVMSRPMPVNLAQANRQLQTYYQANGGVGRVRFTARIDPNAQQIVGRTEATFSKPTMIMGILGVEKSDLKVSAAAAKPGGNLLRVAFRMKHITGAYDKQISLKGRPVGATSDVELMRIVYNNPNAQPGWQHDHQQTCQWHDDTGCTHGLHQRVGHVLHDHDPVGRRHGRSRSGKHRESLHGDDGFGVEPDSRGLSLARHAAHHPHQ